VASHFTIANFEDSVPLGHKEPGFWPEDKVQTGFTRSEARSQFNHFNWGGCELNWRSYLEHYVAAGAAPGSGQVAMHFSGHSHRAGVYTLEWWKGERVLIEGQVPALDEEKAGKTLFIGKTAEQKLKEREAREREERGQEAEEPAAETPAEKEKAEKAKELTTSEEIAEAGTKFVVSGTGGPIGKQALNGWVQKEEQEKTPEKAEKERIEGHFSETETGKAFLGGWLTRPPSGTLADIEGDKLQYVATSDETRNEKPRLAVMLDYRELMSVSKSQYENRPLSLCPDATENAKLKIKNRKEQKPTKFDEGLPVRVSYEMKALKCMQLDKIALWVWEVEQERTDAEAGSSAPPVEQESTGKWVSYSAYIKEVEQPATDGGVSSSALPKKDVLYFTDAGKFIDALGGRGNIQSPKAAFMEVPLQKPAGVSPAGIAWDKEVLCGESWIFPVDIGVDNGGEFVRRSMTESGEIPNWEFLGMYFSNKGYPKKRKINQKDKKTKSSGDTPSDTPATTSDEI
jgi:hypothetical protein